MRIRSSSLVETVAAMAILGFVLATSGLIFANVLQSDRAYQRTLAWAMIEAEVTRIHAKGAWRPQLVSKADLHLSWEPVMLDGSRRSFHFVVSRDGGTVVLEQNRILTGPWSD